MTVQQLINKLQQVEDKNETVEVSINQYNKVGKIALCQIFDNGYDTLQTAFGSHRIEITLPYDNKSFMITSTRKIN